MVCQKLENPVSNPGGVQEAKSLQAAVGISGILISALACASLCARPPATGTLHVQCLFACGAVFVAAALLSKLPALWRHRDSIFKYIYPSSRRIGLRALPATLGKLPVSTARCVFIAAWAFLDLWLRCAPYSIPQVCVCARCCNVFLGCVCLTGRRLASMSRMATLCPVLSCFSDFLLATFKFCDCALA